MRNFLISAALLLATAPVMAQGFHSPSAGTATAVAKPATVARGGHGVLFVTFKISPGFHVNSAKPSEKTLIPTLFAGSPPAGVKFGAAQYGPAKSLVIPAAEPISVYMGTTTIKIPFTVAKNAKPGSRVLAGKVNYQACNSSACYPPTSAPVHAAITVK